MTYEFNGAALIHLVENDRSRSVRSGEMGRGVSEYNVPFYPPSEAPSSGFQTSSWVPWTSPNLRRPGIYGRVVVAWMERRVEALFEAALEVSDVDAAF